MLSLTPPRHTSTLRIPAGWSRREAAGWAEKPCGKVAADDGLKAANTIPAMDDRGLPRPLALRLREDRLPRLRAARVISPSPDWLRDSVRKSASATSRVVFIRLSLAG